MGTHPPYAGSTHLNVATKKAQDKVLEGLELGLTVDQACRRANRSPRTYDGWMGRDPQFKERVAAIRRLHARGGEAPIETAEGQTISFSEFRSKYLKRDTFPHQQQWIDVLEGREPDLFHPAITYEPGQPDMVVVNTAPFHAKTVTLSVDYVVYRLALNPNIRVLLISKTQGMSKKFLYQIKTILTHPMYRDLQIDFGPSGGWKQSADAWTANLIYLGSEIRDSGEKDPTCEALGIGGHIYGARADLIIIDDPVDGSNAHDFDKQIDWIQREVLSRLTADGTCIIAGSRVAPIDLYSEIRSPERYFDGESPWTYLAQPALLTGADDPRDWITLWPKTNMACGCRKVCHGHQDPDDNGLYAKWDGPHLAMRRAQLDTQRWSMVYQQQIVSDDAVFPPHLVNRAVNQTRMAGPLKAGVPGHPEQGDLGHYRIGSMDPAMVGNTAAIVMSVDRASSKRYVLDVHDEPAMTPSSIKGLIKRWTEKYGLHEWRIEKNAFQQYLTQDAELREWLAGRGCVLKEHHTGAGKWDSEFGVASLAPLFGDVDRNTGRTIVEPLIELPATKRHEAAKRMVEQLVTWTPEAAKKQRGTKTDIVMALWFAEIRAREVASEGKSKAYFMQNNKYLTPLGKAARRVINLDEAYLAQRRRVISA